jgi:hypothetical protein
VTAMYSVDDEPAHGGHLLRKGASPQAIRSALLPDDRAAFDTAYDDALAEARSSRDLSALFTMLERWRGVAALHSDPERFARVARRAAEKLTGQPSPDDEPLAVTRAKAGI